MAAVTQDLVVAERHWRFYGDRAAGNRRHNADHVAGRDRSRLLAQVADVLLIDVNIDEAAQMAVVSKKMTAQVGELRGQVAECFLDRRAVHLHSVLFPGIRPEGGWDNHFGWHSFFFQG